MLPSTAVRGSLRVQVEVRKRTMLRAYEMSVQLSAVEGVVPDDARQLHGATVQLYSCRVHTVQLYGSFRSPNVLINLRRKNHHHAAVVWAPETR